MPNLATLVSSAAGAGRIVAEKPSISYTGNSGQFTINNYDPTFIYTITGNGSRSGNTVSVTVLSGSCVITAKAPKGVSPSTSTTLFRQNRTYTTINVPFTQYYNPCGDCRTDVNPNSWSCGCVGADAGGGQWGVCICRGPGYSYQQEDSYSGSGYTFSGSGNEWYKVS